MPVYLAVSTTAAYAVATTQGPKQASRAFKGRRTKKTKNQTNKNQNKKQKKKHYYRCAAVTIEGNTSHACIVRIMRWIRIGSWRRRWFLGRRQAHDGYTGFLLLTLGVEGDVSAGTWQVYARQPEPVRPEQSGACGPRQGQREAGGGDDTGRNRNSKR